MAQVIKMCDVAPEPDLRCPQCGAKAHATCSCGAGYVSVKARVKAAVADPVNAAKSNRLLAGEIGVSDQTVRRARTATNVAVEKRVGKDGKARKAPAKKDKRAAEPTFDEVQEFEEGPVAWRNRAQSASAAAAYAPVNTCPPTKAMLAAARKVVSAWSKIVTHLEKATHHAKS